ncbi:hypothetical protein [Salmonella enterica]|uniref:hypothetical protein n=1 Tax=Salmonella enterica TaxID=28901 RepID=UPI00316490A5
MTDKKRWVLTHDSHELKKGQIYEGETLPAWLVGKAVPATTSRNANDDLEEAHKELIKKYNSLRVTLSEAMDEGAETQKINEQLHEQLNELKAERDALAAQVAELNVALDTAKAEAQAKTKKG